MARTSTKLAARLAAAEQRPRRLTWQATLDDGRTVNLPVRAMLDVPSEAIRRREALDADPNATLPEPSRALRLLARAVPQPGQPLIEGAAIQFAHHAMDGDWGAL